MSLSLNCDICSQSVWKPKTDKLVECSICRLVRAKMNPSEDELQKVYNQNYFFGEEYFDYFQDRLALEKNFSFRLKRLKNFFLPSSVLLEVGCAYGFFLNMCKGLVRKSIGYDIAKEGTDYALKELGLNVYCDDFLNYQGELVDIVCLWDVIEHLPNPDKIIEKISLFTKKGGHLALTTGDVGSLLARIRGDKWRMVHPPTHLFYFDKKTITKLLANYGFKIIYFGHSAVYRNVDSVFNQLISMQNAQKKSIFLLNFLHQICKKTGLSKINFGINLFDIMEVVARKV